MSRWPISSQRLWSFPSYKLHVPVYIDCYFWNDAVNLTSTMVLRTRKESRAQTTIYTHSLLIHKTDTMVVSTSWRSSQFSCKPKHNAQLAELLRLASWHLRINCHTTYSQLFFFQWRRDPSEMSLTWYSWEKNVLLQEVETVMVSSSWTSRECVHGLPQPTCLSVWWRPICLTIFFFFFFLSGSIRRTDTHLATSWLDSYLSYRFLWRWPSCLDWGASSTLP